MTTEQRRLWKQAFGDTDAFLDLFERTAYAPDRCHTLTVEHCLAAALYWLDCETAGEKTAYIYAVATDERFRGRGLCRRLMTETHTRLQGEGYASAVLVAASPSLSEMCRPCAKGVRERFGPTCNTPPHPARCPSANATTRRFRQNYKRVTLQ